MAKIKTYNLVFGLPLTIVGLFICLFIFQFYSSYQHRIADIYDQNSHSLKSAAWQLSESLEYYLANHDLEHAQREIASFALRDNAEFSALLNMDHSIFLSSNFAWQGQDANQVINTFSAQHLEQALQTSQVSFFSTQSTLTAIIPIIDNNDPQQIRSHKVKLLLLQLDLEHELNAVLPVVAAQASPTLFALLLALLLIVWLIHRYVLTPLTAIQNLAIQLKQSDFSLTNPLSGNTLLTHLAQTLVDSGNHIHRQVIELKDKEQRLSTTLQSIGDAVIVTDNLGTISQMNSKACELTGWKVEQALGRELDVVFDIYDPSTCNKISNPIAQLLTDQNASSLTTRCLLLSKTGEQFHITNNAAPIQYSGEQSEAIFGVIIVFQDVSEQKKSEDALRLSARVFSDTHEGIVITDPRGIIIDLNDAATDITGYGREEVLGQNLSFFRSENQSPQFYIDMREELETTDRWQGEIWNRRKNGERFAELLNVFTLRDENNEIVNYVDLFTDITVTKQQEEKLTFLAHYDILTQLPNRTLFVDRFNQAAIHSKRAKCLLAICFIDLDNFKPINDNYGHEIGDQLLVDVARRITDRIREEDTVSRQGGDEFTLLLGDLKSEQHCTQTLERIIDSLAQPYFIHEYTLQVTASIGATLYPKDEGDIDTLLRHADQAMYQAKQIGKNRYQLFNTEQDQKAIFKHHQLNEIKRALKQNEFTLYYQPKVNMVTGEVFGVEALIRWIHPDKGVIPPLDFLPLLDGTELEVEVGHWVMNQAAIQLDEWQQQAIKLEISINISSKHLLSNNFFVQLDEALAKHPSVDSRCLQLEILESSALGNIKTISNVIKVCQSALGVKVALDDFGTGYSSLTHLRNLPADTVKIDQSFIIDMLDDPNDYAIINGIIGLAESFNRDVIAEGVETTNHGLMLLIMGCEKAQGYGIARPMPANELTQWLNNYEPNQEWLVYANKHRTPKEAKKNLFTLMSKQWENKFVSNIQSSPDVVEHWPILDRHLDHCGHWFKRVRQEQLFDHKDLKRIKEVHTEIHYTAQSLLLKYQDDDIDAARAGLPELQAAFKKMNEFVSEC